MITSKGKNEKIDLQFEKLIKSVIEEQGFFKEKDIKKLVSQILTQLEPIIAKHVKAHFQAIGTMLVNNNGNGIDSFIQNTNLTKKDGEKKDAKAS